MPASHERVQNTNLSGAELKQIIKNHVSRILDKDGMLSQHISFGRVAFDVRVSLHLDNPFYPQHVSETLSQKQAVNVISVHPELTAIEASPLDNPSPDEIVISEETTVVIQSPNGARIENGMPLHVPKKNLDTGVVEMKEIVYKGQAPDQADVGNTVVDKTVSDDQRKKWGRGKK